MQQSIDSLIQLFPEKSREKARKFLQGYLQEDNTFSFPAQKKTISIDQLHTLLLEELRSIKERSELVGAFGKKEEPKDPQLFSFEFFADLVEGRIDPNERERHVEGGTPFTRDTVVDAGKFRHKDGLDGIESIRDWGSNGYQGMFGKWNK